MVKEGKTANLVRIIFIMAAVILSGIGIINYVKISDFVNNSVCVDASVTKVESYTDVSGDTKYRAYISYSHNGKKYEDIQLPEYKNYMYEGLEIKDVYVDKDDICIVSDRMYISYVLYIIAGLIVFAVIVTYVVKLKKKHRLLALKITGDKKTGIIESAKIDRTYVEKGKHPYRFECTYPDEVSGNPTYCTSQRTWESPDEYIGNVVDIYVDKKDKSFYYVDLEDLIEKKSHKS